MPRQARLDAPGTLHHVIIRGIERRKIVDNDQDRQAFVKRLGDLVIETKTQVFAWALMTNHAHILLKSSAYGVSKFMSRLLTGYAIQYNRRHGRHGHLFQNRYKSIVCEEEAYFKELTRYIHLNPLRARMVSSVKALEKYPWCGHGVIVGKFEQEWQDRRYVLAWFGRSEKQAGAAYQRFVANGIGLGKQPELVGGGLIRSMGGWSQVQSMRKSGEKERADERVLGSGDFVENLLREADQKVSRQFPNMLGQKQIKQIIFDACMKEDIAVEELKGGSRRAPVSKLRTQITLELIEKHGITPAEVARQMGITISAVSKMIARSRSK